MTLRILLAPMIAISLLLSGVFLVTTPAQADCSYQGYISSGGKCAKSFKSDWRDSYYIDRDDDYRYRYTYQYRYSDQHLLRLIEVLRAMIERLEDQLEDRDGYGFDSDVDVVTRSATDIEEDSATLRGRVDLNREDEAEVWFQYGESRSNLNERTSRETIEEDDSNYTFDADIDDLDDNTVYYFRAVAMDEDDDKDYGVILSFRTDRDGSDEDDHPDLNTKSAEDITDDSAEIRGTVDMNDFKNGDVFFVYGEDEDQIDEVEDDYDEYDDVDEDGEDLQKILADSDLDESDSYQEDIDDLDEDTRIYYSICVGYDDEDDDPVIKCGDTESFRTDEG